MSGKSLSTGTLSLRFMQNAYRAKQLAQVEAKQAQVKDEAEWEVSKEVKEAWGIGTRSNGAESSISYESSYMPFLFERDASDDVAKPRGRRIFNKGGREPLDETKQEATDEPPQTQADVLVHRLRRGPGHPGSISAYSSAGFSSAAQESHTNVKKIKNPPKTTIQEISDSGGTGTNLVHAASSKEPPTRIDSFGTTFLKPSGVDEPAGSAQGSPAIHQNNDVIVEARSQAKVKTKRERETVSESNNKERKRKKKKKMATE